MKSVVGVLSVALLALHSFVASAVELRSVGHHQQLAAAEALRGHSVKQPDDKRKIPVIVHKKEPGNGYLPGSPLYKKQQAAKKVVAEDKKEGAAKEKLDKRFEQAEKETPVEVPGIGEVPAVPVPGAAIFPVPTASRCVVIIAVAYMLLVILLAVTKTYSEFTEPGTPPLRITGILQASMNTMGYGPMLCVLFIAARMRVEFLSEGKDQPQMWVQNCMYATTFAVLLNVILVICTPLVTGQDLPMRKDGTMERPSGSGRSVMVMSALRYFIMLCLYGGIAGVIVGICTYTPPHEDDLSKLPPPAPAVACTMILAVVFFLVQLAIAGSSTYSEFTGKSTSKMMEIMQPAADSASFAPMLSILFLACRMRALQHGSQPQAWAQDCMYSATFALVLTVTLAILVPVAIGGSMEVDEVTGAARFTASPPGILGKALIAAKYVVLFGTYYGCVGVMAGIFTFEHPKGPERTLPVSPAVQCVIDLCFQYFFVYLLLTILQTYADFNPQYRLVECKYFAAVLAAKNTVAIAPMLAILFVTTRMYALLITDNKGAPQAWVQQGMFSATWSLAISFWMCLLMGCFMGKVETDEDGNVVNKFNNRYMGITVTVIRYFNMLLLYGGVATVIHGLFVMTPETANGAGSIPVVSDAVDQTPLSKPPGSNVPVF